MGTVNYYRTFIPDCSSIAKPLFEFISGRCDWLKAQDDAVAKLKDLLSSAPILVPFDSNCKCRLSTDASIVALGGVLERLNEDNSVKGVIGYFSKTVSDTQSRYPVGEIELLAIIEALQHFRYYLHGNSFILRTDHISLLSYNNKSEPSNRVARWLETLAEYDFTLEYIQGPKNVVADALSRPQIEVGAIQLFPSSQVESINPETWFTDWSKDSWCSAVLIKLGIIPDAPFISSADDSLHKKYLRRLTFSSKALSCYKYEDNLLTYNSIICVPQLHRRKITAGLS